MIGVAALPDGLHFEIQEEAFNDGFIPAVAAAAVAGPALSAARHRPDSPAS